MPKERSQKMLNKKLGPEFISYRPGWNGVKVAYLEGWMAIGLANKIFGFDGWSSEIRKLKTEFCDAVDGKFSIGVSCQIRVTLRGGNYHEDVGFGSSEGQRNKGAAFEKAKKEAATDALKRALRQFGNLLGNCCYDRDFIRDIKGVRIPKKRVVDENRLYRRTEMEEDIEISNDMPEFLNSADFK
ncbi:DNA repair and recombination protein RAD52 [Dictyocoela roeselum]|nr:DNA repair and recombination protein RAD52 [Dictyocoela roeselum]